MAATVLPIGLYAVWKKTSITTALMWLSKASRTGFSFAHTTAPEMKSSPILDAADRQHQTLDYKSDVNNFQSEKQRPSILAGILATALPCTSRRKSSAKTICSAADGQCASHHRADGVGGGGSNNYTAYVHATVLPPGNLSMHGASPTKCRSSRMKTIYEDLKLAGSQSNPSGRSSSISKAGAGGYPTPLNNAP